jgi:hypothetical protein
MERGARIKGERNEEGCPWQETQQALEKRFAIHTMDYEKCDWGEMDVPKGVAMRGMRSKRGREKFFFLKKDEVGRCPMLRGPAEFTPRRYTTTRLLNDYVCAVLFSHSYLATL